MGKVSKANLYIGDISEIKVGTIFKGYSELNRSGLHTPTQAGISGNKSMGAVSIVLNGVYTDDEDQGSEIIYTGAGGKDGSYKTIGDQVLSRGNLWLYVSYKNHTPIRIIRGYKCGKLAPKNKYEYRYDGLYLVENFWEDMGKEGFKIYRYQLKAMASNNQTKKLPPGRKLVEQDRIIRNSALINDLKKLYGYKCQICRTILRKYNGDRYAEGAHIYPLGEGGIDDLSNLLCLCANCHVEFDYGRVTIGEKFEILSKSKQGFLLISRQHNINKEYISRHRKKWKH